MTDLNTCTLPSLPKNLTITVRDFSKAKTQELEKTGEQTTAMKSGATNQIKSKQNQDK